MPRPTQEQIARRESLRQAVLDAEDAETGAPFAESLLAVFDARESLARYEGELIAAGVARCAGFNWVET